MFTITSTRIVGLIAVVCAAIVAPQALAMPIIDSQDATPTIIAPPGDEPSVFDPSVLNGNRGYEHQDQYLKGLALAGLAGGTTNTSGGFDLGDLKDRRAVFTAATHKSVDAGSTAAAIRALQRRSVDLNAAYRKLYPGAYRHGSMQTNPGWGAAATEAKKPAAEAAVKTATVVCLGHAEYEYVYSGCEWWS